MCDLSKYCTEPIQLPLNDIAEALAETAFGFSGERLLSYRYQAHDFSKPAPPVIPIKKDKTETPTATKIPRRARISIEKYTAKEKEEAEQLLASLLSKKVSKRPSKDGHGLAILNNAAPVASLFTWQHMSAFAPVKHLKVN